MSDNKIYIISKLCFFSLLSFYIISVILITEELSGGCM